MITFKAENLQSLKDRFPEAIKIKYFVERELSESERPGNKPENVFDFEDGVRLIISKDQIAGKEVIHFSGSIYEKIYRGKMDPDYFLETVCDHFQKLSGNDGPYRLVAVTSNGIPHFYIELSYLN